MVIYIVARYKSCVAAVVRGADPRCFAMVMATGIVSVALRLAGSLGLSAALLWVAAAAFAVLVVASAGRVAAFGPDVRRELRRPDRLFSYFAFPAAASVLAARLVDQPGRGPTDPVGVVAALTVATALAWAAVTCAVVAFLARWAGPRRAIADTGQRRAVADVNGTWQLWVVGTQSAAIAATSAWAAGIVPGRLAGLRLAAWAAIVAWSLGAALYPAVTALVVTRLRVAGLAPGDPVAPYWVTMGAASITVLAAAQVGQLTQAAGPALAGFRSPLTGVGLAFWSVATGLIPALLVLGAVRWRRRGPLAPRGPVTFFREWWMIVFPVGMYATASMRIGAAASLPPVRDVGTAAAWIAAAVWAAVFTWMIVSAAIRLRRL
jgi:tellurite resistance protein TehA-like permease